MSTFIRSLLALVIAASGFALAQDMEWPDLSGETVQVMAVWTDTEQERFEQVLARFEELTGADVQYSPAGGDIGTVIGTRLEGGNPPDIAILPQPGLMVEFAERGALEPIGDIAGDLVDQYYADVWTDLATVDGNLYGVWFKAANKSLVWYNADLFEQAGVEPPETWEEWMNVADTMSQFGVPPFSVGGGAAWTLTDWFENIYVRTAGPELYDQLTNHEIPWTHDSVIEALGYMQQIFDDPSDLAGGVQGTLEANHPTGVSRPFTDPPQAAMAYGAAFSATAIETETSAQVGETARFFPFPSIEGSPPAVIGGGDVAVLFSDDEASAQLIRFLATPEAANVWVELGGFTTPNQGIDASLYPNELLRQTGQQLQEAEIFRFDMSDLQPSEFGGTTGQGLFGGFQEFVRNPDPQEIAEELEEDASEAFGN